jgi:hypothetical protein
LPRGSPSRPRGQSFVLQQEGDPTSKKRPLEQADERFCRKESILLARGGCFLLEGSHSRTLPALREANRGFSVGVPRSRSTAQASGYELSPVAGNGRPVRCLVRSGPVNGDVCCLREAATEALERPPHWDLPSRDRSVLTIRRARRGSMGLFRAEGVDLDFPPVHCPSQPLKPIEPTG